MNKLLLETISLKKDFVSPSGEVLEIFKDVNFSLAKGDTVSIVGPSGSGKTTFLHVIGLLDHPTAGDIVYNGKNVITLTDNEKSSFRNSNIGFVFQMHYLLPEFTALENAMMPLIIRGNDLVESRERASELFEKIGLTNRMDHKPGMLSGGELQRVSLIRAFVGDPVLILADEPTGSLDKKNARVITELFLKLNSEKKTSLVLVTHNEELASMMNIRYRIDDCMMSRI